MKTYPFIEFVVQIRPCVMGLDNQLKGIKDGKSVVDVSAQSWVNVVRLVLAEAGTVP